MAKYRIAILPGDGVGKDVIEATMPILKKLEVDAEYAYGDIGWEFWRREGNALPDRTKKLLKETDACLFGAITSKPKKDADAELDPFQDRVETGGEADEQSADDPQARQPALPPRPE